MMDFPVWLPIAFFVIAFFYSMVGFGGGSSYLAVLLIAGINYIHIPKVALVCNLLVAGTALFHYSKAGHLDFKKAIPFVLLSIPASFIGASIVISKDLFTLLLGLSLLVASLRLFILNDSYDFRTGLNSNNRWKIGLPIGAFLGFLSGLIGIGGGIFLSPILVLMKWVSIKEASAIASFFIIMNSLSGLIGQVLKSGVIYHEIFLVFLIAAFLGGQLGSQLGSIKIPRFALQRVLAVLVLAVSIRFLGLAL